MYNDWLKKRMPWKVLSALLLQALALGLCFIPILFGLDIAIVVTLLALGSILLYRHYYIQAKKFEHVDDQRLYKIMLVFTAATLLLPLTILFLPGPPLLGIIALVMLLSNGLALLIENNHETHEDLKDPSHEYKSLSPDSHLKQTQCLTEIPVTTNAPTIPNENTPLLLKISPT